ncbi:LLM class flavin-dependent oxidoreductase [Actinomadura madurae]|uniref:LLM class flavin-dependent oxidoreductase n=1 Tax=Actinomadura madurae TaxID=1993 RepID=UPI0032B05D75
MRLGIFLLAARFPGQDDAAALSRTVEAAIAAEQAGFDDVWLAEHHFMTYGVVPSATLLAGHILAATTRVHVGTAVSVLSTQHPVALAEQAAMLSLLSGGRFRLGVGRGGPWRDLEVFGTGLPRYEHGFAESLDLLLAWLRSDRVAWSGEHFRFREVPVVPRALVPPQVTVACTSPATEALAAERGLPMLLGMHVGPDEKAAAITRHGDPSLPTSRPTWPRSPTRGRRPSAPSWTRCRAGSAPAWTDTSPWTTVPARPATRSATRTACATCTPSAHRTTASSPS